MDVRTTYHRTIKNKRETCGVMEFSFSGWRISCLATDKATDTKVSSVPG